MHVRVSRFARLTLLALFAAVCLSASAYAADAPALNLQGGGDAAGPVYQNYVVRYGDTLAIIANRYGVSVATLMAANGLRNANMIYAGQVLRIPVRQVQPVVVGPTRDGPDEKLIPDSEAVYSPAYADFDVTAFAQQQPGYFANYREEVDGETLTGAQIVQIIAERFSVGPRVLLTVLELNGGWLTNPSVSRAQQDYPLSITDRAHTGLYYQMWRAANFLNAGYYGKLLGRMSLMTLEDNSRVRFAASLNPGTAAAQNLLANTAGYDNWQNLVGANGFKATYQKLFGDPFARAIEPLVPADVQQPALRLPFADGATWYYTGGPHGAWADGSAWAAVDFAPMGPGGCVTSREWAIAAASGRVVQSEHGRVMLNLDSADFQGKGWTLMYMHMQSNGRVAKGASVSTGDRIGHPSCEGGFAQGSHLHIARMYNGQWMSVASQSPFVMSGWQFKNAASEYDGTMLRDGVTRLAVNGHVDRLNGVMADSGSLIDALSLAADNAR